MDPVGLRGIKKDNRMDNKNTCENLSKTFIFMIVYDFK